MAISAAERDQAAMMLRAVLTEQGLSPGEGIAVMLCAIERIVCDGLRLNSGAWPPTRPRVKNGKPSVHPLRGDEIRALRSCAGNSPTVASSLHPSGAARSQRTPSIGLLSVLASVPPLPSWFIVT